MKTKMKYAIIIFVVLITQSCSNEKIENDWTRNNLQGKVLSYSEFSYKAENRFGNVVKGKRKRKSKWLSDIQKKYNEKGNQVESNRYNSDGSLIGKRTYKYDEKGNKIESNWYNSDGSLDSKTTRKYEFDKQGNWLMRIDSEDEIPNFILEREYEYYD